MKNQRILLFCQLVVSRGLDYELERPFEDQNCPDLDLSYICVGKCTEDWHTCATVCHEHFAYRPDCNEDVECIQNCNREEVHCTYDCPCHANCPNGCIDCPNSICQWSTTSSTTTDQTTTIVTTTASTSATGSTTTPLNTTSSTTTISTTSVSTSESTTESTVTGTTLSTTTKDNPDILKSILVLGNEDFLEQKDPFTMNLQGDVEFDISFTYGDATATYRSCGATLNGEFMVIGGGNDKKQISRINGCQLERIGSLDFEYSYGACNTYYFDKEKILFCFREIRKDTSSKECHTYDGESVQLGDATKHDHDFIFHLASYQGQPLVTGDKYHTKTEKLNLESGKWEWMYQKDYPFHTRIFCYSTASTETAAYFIGGEDVGGQYFSTIAEFKDDEWRKIGDLAKARSSPSSITIGDETVILGGYALAGRMMPTEVWNFKTLEHGEIDPALVNGEYRYPILFPVESGYCKNNDVNM